MLVADAVATALTELGAPRHADHTLRGHSRTLASRQWYGPTYLGLGSVGQWERWHDDRAVAACCVEAVGGAAVDEFGHHLVDASADAERVPDVREDHRAAVGEVLLQVGEVRERILRVGAAHEGEHRHAAGRRKPPERVRLGALRD